MIAFMLSYHVYRRYGLLLPCTDVFIDQLYLAIQNYRLLMCLGETYHKTIVSYFVI